MARRRAASLGRSGELALDVFGASYESRVSFIPRARMLSDALTDPVRAYWVGCSNRKVSICGGYHRFAVGIISMVLRCSDPWLNIYRRGLKFDR